MAEGTTTIVIIGASGDLAQRRLVPALFSLACKGRLPGELRVVGSARTPYSDDQFREGVRGTGYGVQGDNTPYPVPHTLYPDQWADFAQRLFYVPADLSSVEDFQRLRQRIEALEGGQRPANRLFYLAIAPQLYEAAIRSLGASGLSNEDSGWRRVVIEKPFGWDLDSARALNKAAHEVFREDQVFRIDHYLGKETVQNLLVLRFANTIFEPVWNRNYIANVQITVAEDAPVGDRGGYYDRAGVVRDMVQNHLLQLLCLVAMEPSSASDPESLRTQKVEVLRAVRKWPPEEALRQAVGGQYAGYLSEKGVAANSRTPTFAAIRLLVDNWRWHGVPFYLRTGKRLATKASEIVIQFQRPPHVLLSLGLHELLSPNVLGICLQPDEGVHLRFGVKVPDHGMDVRSVDMEFHYGEVFKQPIPDAYELLLSDALEGDASLFIRNDHIEEAWKIVDPLLQAWEEGDQGSGDRGQGNNTPIPVPRPLTPIYEPGSWGPSAADALLAQDGRAWLRVCGAHD
jgi:glucose-6-phosphate 1-dehydrogenase